MSDKTTVTTTTTSTTATTASSVNVTTPFEESAYTSIQEGAMKLRLKRTKSKPQLMLLRRRPRPILMWNQWRKRVILVLPFLRQ